MDAVADHRVAALAVALVALLGVCFLLVARARGWDQVVITFRDPVRGRRWVPRLMRLLPGGPGQQDPLTGLATREVLSAEGPRLLAEAEQAGGHSGLLLLDLDGFKAVNDTLEYLADNLKARAEQLAAG